MSTGRDPAAQELLPHGGGDGDLAGLGTANSDVFRTAKSRMSSRLSVRLSGASRGGIFGVPRCLLSTMSLPSLSLPLSLTASASEMPLVDPELALSLSPSPPLPLSSCMRSLFRGRACFGVDEEGGAR